MSPLGIWVLAPSVSQVAQVTRLIKDHDPNGPGVLHGDLQNGICLFLANVATDDAMLESCSLIRVQLVTCQLAAHHTTQGVDEVSSVQVGEPVLI